MSRRWATLRQLTLWKIREFIREPEALFWVFAFPVVLALALGIAFRSRGPEEAVVAVRVGPGAAPLAARLDSAPLVRASVLDQEEAGRALAAGKVSVLVVPGDTLQLVLDSARSESQLANLLVRDALRRDAAPSGPEIREIRLTEPGTRYIDFLIPGLLGLNIMGTGLWGVGFGIVRDRNQQRLKRLISSPMRKSEYLLAHVMFRLVFLGFEVGTLLLFGHLAFGVPVRGSLITVAFLVVLGAMAFSGLGLLTASRAKTLEGVSGLMNLIMVPMWITSGVFFSYSHFPEVLHPVIRALPLTALNDAVRAVMLEGATLPAVTGMAVVVALWGALSFGAALRVFRWV